MLCLSQVTLPRPEEQCSGEGHGPSGGFSFKEVTLKGLAVSCLVRYLHFIYLKSDLFLSTPTLVGSDNHPDFLLMEK